MVVSIENAEHYLWADVCDGWRLLMRDDMSVIQERVPPGAAEATHYHTRARQFFYIIEGQGTMTLEDRIIVLEKGQGIEVHAHVKHQFRNESPADVHFLVISVPSTSGDRVNL